MPARLPSHFLLFFTAASRTSEGTNPSAGLHRWGNPNVFARARYRTNHSVGVWVVKTSVLFLCVANMCRSQMAEGYARTLGGDVLEAYSAGAHPGLRVHPMSVTAMHEEGIDIRAAYPKSIQELPLDHFDIVVSLCADRCPQAMADEHRHWDVGNPDGFDEAQFRRVRDQIRQQVEWLIADVQNKRGA